MKRKSILAIILSVIMVASSFTTTFAAREEVSYIEDGSFTDISSHWGADAITKWSGYGVINGYNGLFRPNDSITRGEMAVILDNMMDYQVVAENTFTDLATGKFYTEAVLKAKAAGIIQGSGANVRPIDKITREEAAVMLGRAFGIDASNSGVSTFKDSETIAVWAMGYVTAMQTKGYVKGSNNNLLPKTDITRAEIVTIIDNIVKAYYTVAGTYTDDVDGTAIIKVSDVTLKGVAISENLIIAEGVGQGNVILDNVTVTGDTVVRGGGENSVHITGTSSLTSIRIEKTNGIIRIVVSDGNTVREIEVADGEEIIIEGIVGTLNIEAPNSTVYATDADITSAYVNGENSTIIVDSKSKIGTITAEVSIKVMGNGKVSNVDLTDAADGSSITTPDTKITVGDGVSGVTGGGGKPITEGTSEINNTAGDDLVKTVVTSTGRSSSSAIAVSAITVTGDAVVGATLTAAPTPTAATGTYQWQFSNEADGTYVIIDGATSSTYVIDNAYAGKFIKVTFTASGSYTGTQTSTAKGTVVTPLTITDPTLTTSKVYDGNTTAVVTAGTLSGVIVSDDVTVSAVANYDTELVGTGKTITVVYTLEGADAAKYTKPVNYTVATGAITAIQLTITEPTLTLSKAYDGTTAAVVTAGALSEVIGSDDVTVNAVATYVTAVVGTGKTITVVYTLAGTDAENYVKPLDYTVTTGEITAVALTITDPTLTTSKAYDGNTTAVVTAGTLNGVVSGTVTVSAVATYDTADLGTGKTITVVYTLGGTDAGNYIKPVDYTVTTGEITLVQVTSGQFIVQPKVDNTVTITLTGGTFKAGDIVAGDFTLGGTDAVALAAGTFTRVGDAVVTITGLAGLEGTDNTVLVKAATQATQATSVAAVASRETTDEKYFTFDSIAQAITSYDEAGGLNVVIPSTINGFNVTSIGNSAFRDKNVISVTIPYGVTSIGDLSFYSCSSLTNVTIPDSVTSIGDGSFRYCSSLTNVTIPDSVTSIGMQSFQNCNLLSVTLSAQLVSIDYQSFAGNSNLTSVTIPDSVTLISNGAFQYCSSLTSVTIPDSVITIASSAFAYCSSLNSVTLSDHLEKISSEAFVGCALTTVTIPDSVTEISLKAFLDNNLTSITIGASVTIGDNLLSDSNNNFRDAYTAGGAGTYSGTQTSTWVKVD